MTPAATDGVARVSTAACSAGSRYVSAAGSYSTTPPAVIAPSHARTYRPFSPAAAATPRRVDGGSSAIASNSPVRWPSDVIRSAAAAFRVSIIRPAKASARPASKVVVMSFLRRKKGSRSPARRASDGEPRTTRRFAVARAAGWCRLTSPVSAETPRVPDVPPVAVRRRSPNTSGGTRTRAGRTGWTTSPPTGTGSPTASTSSCGTPARPGRTCSPCSATRTPPTRSPNRSCSASSPAGSGCSTARPAGSATTSRRSCGTPPAPTSGGRPRGPRRCRSPTCPSPTRPTAAGSPSGGGASSIGCSTPWPPTSAAPPAATSAGLARRVAADTGVLLTPAAYRKQLSRARRLFAALLVCEVGATLRPGTRAQLENELAALGVLNLVTPFLRGPGR